MLSNFAFFFFFEWVPQFSCNSCLSWLVSLVGFGSKFLTGQEEIESVERLVLERLPQLSGSKEKLLTFPIFSSLPSEKQMKVFQPAPVGFRKELSSFRCLRTFSWHKYYTGKKKFLDFVRKC
ncbi:putative ATP-dependent RNA helicase DHX33 [Olea europaea var. sylvestris]|uniref:putative ATP-dependent RNA helicase DHX33 n=1 Tax=Olea europaea var. sylvestris TaxID=158386 RepID=UPI000C1D72F9|nr:putative ATP-dependent RNA helicase DHX33 [Olea europaea var. sylvestris]